MLERVFALYGAD